MSFLPFLSAFSYSLHGLFCLQGSVEEFCYFAFSWKDRWTTMHVGILSNLHSILSFKRQRNETGIQIITMASYENTIKGALILADSF